MFPQDLVGNIERRDTGVTVGQRGAEGCRHVSKRSESAKHARQCRCEPLTHTRPSNCFPLPGPIATLNQTGKMSSKFPGPRHIFARLLSLTFMLACQILSVLNMGNPLDENHATNTMRTSEYC